MFNRLLPQRIDNTYRGHKVALWLFALVVFLKTSIGLGTIFNGRNAAISADGIPLDTFTPAGADAFVSLFAAWGLVAVYVIGLVAERACAGPNCGVGMAIAVVATWGAAIASVIALMVRRA